MNINEKPVTSFDLEPNPFEQSFASTKKGMLGGRLADKGIEQGGVAGVIANGAANGVSVGVAIPGGPSPGARQSNAPPLDSKSRLLMNIGGQASAQVAGCLGPGQAKPPNIQSPPILSPGGSRRLPPLTLSPNTAISNVLQGQTSPGAFYLNLPKTGLTPNESNIRSGLTPAIMNANGPGNGNNGSNAVGNTNGISAIPVALTSSTGLTPGRFSPMLNSLLNMPRGPMFPVANTNNNTNNTTNNNINTTNNVNNSHNTNTNIDMNNTNIDGRAMTNQSKDNSILNNKSPNSSPNNSNIMSADSNTTQSAISNSASQLVLSTDITLGQVKNSEGMARSVYNNDDPKSVAKHKSGPRSQSKKNGTSTEYDNKENVSSVNGNVSPSSSSSLKNKSGTKKRKVSTSSKSKPKSSPNESDNFSEPTYDGGSDAGDTEADRARKRQEFLERNRIAASRFRKRKKEYIKRIEADLSFYESEYNDLTACLASLTGISPHSNNSMGNPSLINSLKQALITQDLKSALQLCDMLEHTVLNTKYVQRNGVNPRELSHRSEDMGESDA